MSVCVFFQFEKEHQRDDAKKTRTEFISIAIALHFSWERLHATSSESKFNVKKNQISKKEEAEAQERDKNPITGVICSSSKTKSNPNALFIPAGGYCGDWTEYLAEEAPVKACKLQSNTQNKKGRKMTLS